MVVIWLDRARHELLQIRDYIAADNPTAAEQAARRILETAERLRNTPHIGRPGRISGTREFVIARTPFIIVYRVRDQIIEILRVRHASRRWPDIL